VVDVSSILVEIKIKGEVGGNVRGNVRGKVNGGGRECPSYTSRWRESHVGAGYVQGVGVLRLRMTVHCVDVMLRSG